MANCAYALKYVGLRHQPLSQPTEQVVRCLEVSSVELGWHCLEHSQNHLPPQATAVQPETRHLVAVVKNNPLISSKQSATEPALHAVIQLHTMRHAEILFVCRNMRLKSLSRAWQ